jgi:hypothetical protein
MNRKLGLRRKSKVLERLCTMQMKGRIEKGTWLIGAKGEKEAR